MEPQTPFQTLFTTLLPQATISADVLSTPKDEGRNTSSHELYEPIVKVLYFDLLMYLNPCDIFILSKLAYF